MKKKYRYRQIIYEEEGYADKYKIKYPKYGLILYISILLVPTLMCALGWSNVIINKSWNWYLFAVTLNLIGAIAAIWYAVLGIYWHMYKTYRNVIKVTIKGIYVGSRFFPKENVKKSVFNLTNGFLYIYPKKGRKFKICKDISKISYFGGGTHFSYTEYGNALKKLGIPFEVVRRKGLFGVERVRGREAYKEIRHRERYEKWIKSQQKGNGKKVKIEGGDR